MKTLGILGIAPALDDRLLPSPLTRLLGRARRPAAGSHSPADPNGSRDLRAHGAPRVPARRGPKLHGKEGSKAHASGGC
jgi:hypothetical protein